MRPSLHYGLSFLTLLSVASIMSGCASSGSGQPAPGGLSGAGTAPLSPPPPPPVGSTPSSGTQDRSSFETAEYQRNYALDRINASAAYAAGATGAGIVVAVIDSGALDTHAELRGQISSNSTDIVNTPLPLTDTNGHGTQVAGIIAGLRNDSGIHGLAYESTILAIRANNRSASNPSVDNCGFVNAGCGFEDRNVAAAIDYAVENGARIINLSLGSGASSDPELDAALGRAVEAGIVIVAAAGNADRNTPDNPASFAGTVNALGRALAVGATDQNNLIARFSNRAGTGETQNFFLVAPGVDILTSSLDKDNPDARDHLETASGSSFATPYVSGAIALLLQAFPELKPEGAVSLLIDTAVDLGTPGVDSTYGAGLIDLAAAFSPQGQSKTQFKGQTKPVDLSALFTAPQGAFGDWAETGGAFAGLVFRDGYGRRFTTAQDVRIRHLARSTGLLDNQINAQRAQNSHTVFGLGSEAKWGFGEVKLRRQGAEYSRIWRDPVMQDFTHMHDPLLALTQDKVRNIEFDAALHLGRFHFGAGQGYASAPGGTLSDTAINTGGAYSLVGDASWTSAGFDIADDLTFGAVNTSGDRGSVNALTLKKTVGAHSFTGEWGAISENTHVLGSNFLERFGQESTRSTHDYMALGWQGHLPQGWQAQAGMEYAKADINATDVLQLNGQPYSTAWSFAAQRNFSEGRSLSLNIYQPLRVENGSASFDAPIDITEDGELVFENRTVSLSPSGREINMQASYSQQLDHGFSLSAGAQIIRNPGHSTFAQDEGLGWISLKGKW